MGQKLSSKLLFIYSPNTDGFYIFHISQGSVAMQLRCGGMFSNHLITNFSQSAPVKNKKAQLTLSNPRDVKACKNCSNSTCFVSFHRIPFPQITNMHSFTRYVHSGSRPRLYCYTQFEIRKSGVCQL